MGEGEDFKKKSREDHGLLSSWLFSKILLLDRPGILINQANYKSKNQVKKRLVFEFEELMIQLQKETIKKLGRKKSFDLWYKIGKDWGHNYFLFLVKQKDELIDFENLFKKWCLMVSKNGTSLCEKVFFENNSNKIILEGKDNVICRISKEKGFFIGAFAGFLSFLKKKSVEGFSDCSSCPKNCRAVFNVRDIDKELFFSKFDLIKDFEQLNFPKPFRLNKKVLSAQDFIKFNKLSFGKKKNLNYSKK